MATTSVDISIDADGSSLAVLADLIAKREKYMRGETTETAVTATAINILSSVRAATMVARPDGKDFDYRIMPAPGVVAGFKRDKGSKFSRRVVRERGGHEMSSSLVVNLAGKSSRGENVLCFVVIHKSQRLLEILKGLNSERYERHYVIAKSANDVKQWANQRMRNYVKKYAGMAKWVIGQAQSRVAAYLHNGDGVEPTPKARAVALANLVVNVGGNGFDDGNFFVEVKDGLKYSMVALKNGEASFAEALKKAANRTAAIINKLGTYRLQDPIPTPFPEVTKKKS